MTIVATLVADRMRGREQLNLSGKRTTLTVTDGHLTINGAGGAGRKVPLQDIKHLRIGTVQVNPSGTVTMGGFRRTEAQIQLAGVSRPLVIESSPDSQAFQQFFASLAEVMLARGGVVERGRGYGIPAVWAGVFLVGAVWQVRSIAMTYRAGDDLLAPIMVTLVMLGILGSLVVWAWNVYAPRRIVHLSELDTLTSNKPGTITESSKKP